VAQYEVGTVVVKLAAIRQLHEAAVGHRLRQESGCRTESTKGQNGTI
jgi:hypothetical protein